MTAAGLRATSRVLRTAPVVVPATAAALLAGAVPLVPAEQARLLLLGVAVLLGCVAAAALDDPAAEVLSASPTGRPRRWAMRVVVTAAYVAPVWAAAVALAVHAHPALPWRPHSVQAAGTCALALATAATLRRRPGLDSPSAVAAALAFLTALAPFALPPAWAMLPVAAATGPAEIGLQLRWTGVLLLAAAVVLAAAADPLDRWTAPGHRPGRKSGSDQGRPLM